MRRIANKIYLPFVAHLVSVLTVHPREIQALWSQTTTKILRRYAVQGVDNAMSACHRTGYDTLRQAQDTEV